MISVCIATYNGEKFIKTQIDSILSQLGDNDEIVISDDSSTDKTVEILSSFNDKRIKIFPQQRFRNPIFNFENALRMATGDYIFLSDQDDKWATNKIEVMMKELQEFDLVVSNAYIVDEHLETLKDSYFDWRHSGIGIVKNLVRNSYLGCCMAFKRSMLERILPFPKNIPMHDMWIGMVAEFYYKPTFIVDKLMYYRRHGGNATVLNKDFKSNETLISRLKFRYNLMSSIVRRHFMDKNK